MSKQYKVGIIGAGNIVESSHLPVLQNLPNAEVAWIYDINQNRTGLLSSMYAVQTLGGAPEEGIKNVDICLITIPYGVRQNYYQACSAAGKAVYVEKPFALSEQEHLQTSSMFRPYQLAIGFQRRSYKIVYQLRQLVQSGVFGKLKSIAFTQGYFSLKGGRGYLSDAKLAGGGVIIESAIHSFDQMLQITNATDVEVLNVDYLQKNGIDYDSVTNSVLTTPTGSVDVVSSVSTLRNLKNGVVFTFENAWVECRFSADSDLRVYANSGKQLSFDIEALLANENNIATTVGASFYFFWKKFLEALDEEKANFTSAQESLLTTKWMEKIYGKIK
ncbi:Gfo/Idh/MocA family oxidoreductase [Segetibacter sp. 3557_3]|uniref:Gfo/Idh/MocA family protein n=1 Tax=Segetibacter sp. 3557_3 TaxID=2547429 RepID=UPI0010588BC5|nr:Gfo/Idh/MocA family oxidoreductase [Segetibacter sp. 3557_3]TDH23309.1 Gfo/Idh/MocA family oxidoreductase [Segetibacter sp. 3557_3]